MFNNKRIEKLEDQVRTLKANLKNLRLAHLTVNGDYKFKVGEEVEILRGKFKVQNRGYSDRSRHEWGGAIHFEFLTPVYCLVGLDNEDVIYPEEAELKKDIAEFKSINERID